VITISEPTRVAPLSEALYMEVDRQYTHQDEPSDDGGVLEDDEEHEASDPMHDGTNPGSLTGSLRKVSDGMKLTKGKSVHKSRGQLSGLPDDHLAQSGAESKQPDPEELQAIQDALLVDDKIRHVESEVDAQISKTDNLIEEKLNAKNKKKK
jgi:hypothetical protein